MDQCHSSSCNLSQWLVLLPDIPSLGHDQLTTPNKLWEFSAISRLETDDEPLKQILNFNSCVNIIKYTAIPSQCSFLHAKSLIQLVNFSSILQPAIEIWIQERASPSASHNTPLLLCLLLHFLGRNDVELWLRHLLRSSRLLGELVLNWRLQVALDQR